MTGPFDLFAAVDWSGARGEFHKGISVAVCAPGSDAPEILTPPNKTWSREGVIKVLGDLAQSNRVLCGFDFSFSSPFMDKGFYFPAMAAGDAPALWQEIESICREDAHLSCASFVEHPDLKELFLTGKGRGAGFEARFRLCETLCRARGLGRAESLFHLVGPSQVGLASFTGMRALLRLENYAIWPFNKPAKGASIAVEIFTRLFLTHAGAGQKKLTALDELNRALMRLCSDPLKRLTGLDDHKADALVSAAGLRRFAGLKGFWKPAGMTNDIAKTEGWTFGVP